MNARRLAGPLALLATVAGCGGRTPARPGQDAGAPAADSLAPSPFVTVCGTSLCLGGAPFVIHGATAYGQYTKVASEIALATSGRVNTLEIVNFEPNLYDLASVTADSTWRIVDAFIAAAAASHLHVILNLSSYGNALIKAGYTIADYDWGPFLDSITGRTNTVSGVRYRDDPTLAMIELWGEIPPPGSPSWPGPVTTADLNGFFHTTLARLRAGDPNHLLSSGGMSYLNFASGIDWQTIMKDANDDVCSFEINSNGDRDTTVPAVTSFCQGLGKPWFLAAWSACIGNAPRGCWDIDNYPDDASASLHAKDMYAVAADASPAAPAPAMAAVGADFWNLGDGTAPTCDLNPGFPLTWAVVQSTAP